MPRRSHEQSPPLGQLSRRGFVQSGFSGVLGLGMAEVLAGQARATRNEGNTGTRPAKAQSVILVFLTGAASHHDTFDMKPDAPAEIRGQFKRIDTDVPGVQVCEHLPLVGARMKQFALVRSLA